MKLSNAEFRVLSILARRGWVDGSSSTVDGVIYARVHTVTARRLSQRGLVKSRAQIGDRAITGIDLARYLGFWEEYFAITAKGRRVFKAAASKEVPL